MIALFSLILLLLQIVSNVNSSKKCCSNSDSTLVMAQVILRHGARNIEEPYPNDPWKNEKYWPGGFSQLTNLGKKQQYKLGKWLPKRYHAQLFPHGYSADKIYILSTDTDRTIMSAEATSAGLFPPTKEQIWNKNLAWQPVPVHTVSKSMDLSIRPSLKDNPCPLHDKLMERYEGTFYQKHNQTLSYTVQQSGLEDPSLDDILEVYDTLEVEKEQNKALPLWTRPVYDELQRISTFRSQSFTGTPALARLIGGFFLKDLLENFTNKTKSTLSPDRTFFMYSGHKVTIINILNTLGLFDWKVPPVSSCVILELHRLNGEYFIQIFYKKKPSTAALPLNIPNCGFICPLEQFRKIYQSIIPTMDYDTECQTSG